MNTTPTQLGNQQTPNESPTLQRMRWFIIIFLSIWTLTALTLPIIMFYLANNLFYLSGFTTVAPPIWILIRIIKHLFPLSKEEYELTALKIKHSGSEQSNKKRMP